MNMSDEEASTQRPPVDAADLMIQPRRPSSWVSEDELRRRSRRRSLIYLSVAAVCMLMFIVLIYLLLERTRWSAGSSPKVSGAHPSSIEPQLWAIGPR